VSKQGLSRPAKIYLTAVIAAGSLVIARSIYQLIEEPIGIQWFILAALTVVSGSASVKLPSSPASISISETFVITGALLYGPAAGTVLTALDGLVLSFWMSRRHTEAHRALFNVSAPAFSAWCSAQLFFLVSGIPPLVREPASINSIIPALILFALTYFGLNSWLVTFVIAIEQRLDPVKVWTDNFLLLSLNYFAGASVAILFVGFTRTIDLGYIGIILPLLLLLYFTFKFSMSRVEDANKHVDELNRLYLSTIETFAMAIDAKDQVTHGHIRRVQQHALSLARELGIRDSRLIKAIEAAALLHDMGKLAVPEYILNKPGKLTDSEFAKMKLHASVGADILSAVDFPYPVVPIVRHHHENWDGSGYPSGLRGTSIPIGARILSVVDCFDALTSDRPYRPRLSEDEAMKIVMERRGTMYDPLIVDSFARIQKAIAPVVPQVGPGTQVLTDIASVRYVPKSPSRPLPFQEIAASSGEMLTLLELARNLAGKTSVEEACEAVVNALRRLIPSSLCIFFTYDKSGDHLEIRHTTGEGAAYLIGLRIQRGQRVSGWVAANRQTICNSDPVLDLGDSVNLSNYKLRSCLSTPLVHNDDLIGVISLYAIEADAFTDTHRRIIEAVAHQISPAFKLISGRERSDPAAVRGLQPLETLEQVVQQKVARQANVSFAAILIEVLDLDSIARDHGHRVVDDVIQHVIHHSRRDLRDTDLLGRNSWNEFVALLSAADHEAALAIAARVHERLASVAVLMPNGVTLNICATVTPVCIPEDGMSLSELCAVARRRSRLAKSSRAFHVH